MQLVHGLSHRVCVSRWLGYHVLLGCLHRKGDVFETISIFWLVSLNVNRFSLEEALALLS